MEGHGRSQEERAAAREARDRARIAREQGIPLDDEEEQRPDLGSMNRYGGGPNLANLDVYTKRRIIAAAVGVGVILVLFLMVGGC